VFFSSKLIVTTNFIFYWSFFFRFLLIPLCIFVKDFVMFMSLITVFTHSIKDFIFCVIVIYIHRYWSMIFFMDLSMNCGFFLDFIVSFMYSLTFPQKMYSLS